MLTVVHILAIKLYITLLENLNNVVQLFLSHCNKRCGFFYIHERSWTSYGLMKFMCAWELQRPRTTTTTQYV